MWFAEQLNSFLNLGECKEYPIMARSKSIPGSKVSRTGAGNGNKEQSDIGNPVTSSEVKASAAAAIPASVSETKAAAPVTPEVKATPESRKLEVVKSDPKNDSRKNVVPINLEDEIRRRAYELYQQRGSTSGSEAEDWLAAEREVRQRYRQQSA
jgi:hypothetical protein